MSLFEGVRENVQVVLRLRSLNHKEDLLRHRDTPLSAAMGRQAVECVFQAIQGNVAHLVANRGVASIRSRPSKMNWRMNSPGTACDDKNKLREVGLERAVVAAFREAGNQDWWNQVPVASGLYGSAAGKRRAIDLVRRRGPSTYDFIELKLKSNTPLYAAIEILEYGFAWYFSREEPRIGYEAAKFQGSLLGASSVHLSVLAPAAFYCGASYSAFAEGISSALGEITGPARITFDGFKHLAIPWTRDVTPAQLREEVGRLYPPGP